MTEAATVSYTDSQAIASCILDPDQGAYVISVETPVPLDLVMLHSAVHMDLLESDEDDDDRGQASTNMRHASLYRSAGAYKVHGRHTGGKDMFCCWFGRRVALGRDCSVFSLRAAPVSAMAYEAHHGPETLCLFGRRRVFSKRRQYTYDMRLWPRRVPKRLYAQHQHGTDREVFNWMTLPKGKI